MFFYIVPIDQFPPVFHEPYKKAGYSRQEEHLMIRLRRGGIGLALSLFISLAAPAVSYASTSANTSTPIFQDNFNSGTLAPFVANNGMSPGGNWSITHGALTGKNYGLTHNLADQIASVPQVGRNTVLTASFTINQLNPHQPYRIGVFGRGSAPKTGSSQWDVVFSNGNLDLINQFLGMPAQIPFPVKAGQSYNMVAVVDGTWVGAQVWPKNAPEPSQWTISASFTNSGPFTAVGVAAANADVSFHHFIVYSAPAQLSVKATQPSSVYQTGQPLTYTATLSANTPHQIGQPYAVNYVLSKLGGAIAAQGTVPVTIPDSGRAQFTLSLPEQPNGYYHVTFSLTPASTVFPFTTSETFQSNTTSLAVVPSTPDFSGLNPSSPFGINGPGNQYGPITPSLAQHWIKVDQLFKNQGVQWVRTQFLWNYVEPSPGSYTWNSSDGLVLAGHATHENILGLVDYAGNYANPFTANRESRVSFSTFIEDYDQYIQALVKRYMPGGTLAQQLGWHNYGISTWEIWNEPSQKQYWPSKNPVQYAELVKSASAAVKAVDPNATVLAYNWQYPTLVHTAGAKSFTGLSLHAYPTYPSQSAFYQAIADLRHELVQSGVGSDPIWMTETGWSIARVSATLQAEYLQRAAIQSLAASLNKFFLFDWSYPSSGYGELTKSLLPLPAYPALAAVSAELNGYTPVPAMNPIDLGSAIRAFVFQNGSNSLVALWAPKNQGHLTLNSAGQVSAANWMANPILPTSSGLIIPLTSQPVFVTGDMSPQQLVARIQSGTVTGVAPVSLAIQPGTQPIRLSPIQVTITNQVNVSESGTLTLNLPPGWKALPTSSSTSTTPSATPSVAFGPLQPGASIQDTFDLVQFQASPTNQYPLTATATTSTDTSPIAVATSNINPHQVVYGTPGLTGSFSSWGSATPLYINRSSQNVGIPNWSTGQASAKAYALWNTHYLYVAAQVVDAQPFFQPYDQSNMWKGDSVQIYINPTNKKTTSYNSANKDTLISLAKTPKGGQVYERHPATKLLTNVKLTVVPGPSHGDMLYEAAIPVADLPLWAARNGQSFGLNMLVNYNFGHGRVGWMELAPGVGNGFDSADFPTFRLVNAAGLAALTLSQKLSTSTLTFTANAARTELSVTNHGLNTIAIALSNGTTLTLNGSAGAKPTVAPSGPDPSVPILLNGTTTIKLAQYVSPRSSMSLTASTSPESGTSATLTLDNGVK